MHLHVIDQKFKHESEISECELVGNIIDHEK